MITFYRPNTDSFSDRIQERLENLVIRHHIEILNDSDAPYITEGDTKAESKEAIEYYITNLEREVNASRSVSGDSCYIDPITGQTC